MSKFSEMQKLKSEILFQQVGSEQPLTDSLCEMENTLKQQITFCLNKPQVNPQC